MLDKSVPYLSVIMTRGTLPPSGVGMRDYPQYALPDGYSFSGYREGLADKWARLIYGLGHVDSLEQAQDIFKKDFLARPELLPTQCLFVLDKEGEVAASASLWQGDNFGETLPMVHWVSTAPEHQGKGLVKALMTRLFDIHCERRYSGFIYLTSSTWSYKALNLYTKFGFMPYKSEKPVNWNVENFEENTRRAWEIIEEKIGMYIK